MQSLKLLSASLALLCLQGAAAAPAPSPVRVFILAGQSNMEGQGVADLEMAKITTTAKERSNI